MVIDDLIEVWDIRSTANKNFGIKESIKFYIPEKYTLYSRDIAFTNMDNVQLVSKLPYENICLIFLDYILFVHEINNSKLKYSYYSESISVEDAKNFIQIKKSYIGKIFNTKLLLITEFNGHTLKFTDSIYKAEIPKSVNYASHGGWGMGSKEIEVDIQITIVRHLIALNKFLSFLSCKNIKTVLHSPPEKIQKKRIMNNKLPLFSYHTLILDTSKNDNHSSESKELWTNRVHLCRGHVARYGAKYGTKKLFGKYEGSYWIPPHVRGNKSKGIIHKEYKFES